MPRRTLKWSTPLFYLYVALSIIAGIAILVATFAFVMHTIGKGMDPSHVLVNSMRLKQPPQAVFEAVSNAAGWPAWDPGVTRVETLPTENGNPTCRMVMGHNSMHLVTTRSEAPRLLERVVRDEGKRLMFSGTWLHEITPDSAGGCVVKLTEHGTIHIPLPRAMARKLADPAMFLKRHLRRLAAKFGEEAKIE